jgi:hypothetical protein
LADLYSRQGRDDDARALLEEAWGSAREAPEQGGRLASIAFRLADLLWRDRSDPGNEDRAIELAKEARRRWAASGIPELNARTEDVDAWLEERGRKRDR